jgi:hypothetical protein
MSLVTREENIDLAVAVCNRLRVVICIVANGLGVWAHGLACINSLVEIIAEVGHRSRLEDVVVFVWVEDFNGRWTSRNGALHSLAIAVRGPSHPWRKEMFAA